jgi:predicted nucleotidyltransferase
VKPNTIARDEALEKIRGLAKELGRVLGDRLLMAAAYGSVMRGDFDPQRSDVNLLLCVESADTDTLTQLAGLLQEAHAAFRCSPFLLSRQEIERGVDVFAVRFTDIRKSHVLLEGTDLLGPLKIEPRDLRFACEHDLRNALLKLRRAYLMERPNVGPMLASVRTFVPQILDVLRLLADPGEARADASQWVPDAARKVGFAPFAVLGALALRDGPRTPWIEVERRMGALFAAIERICEYTDRLPDD